MKDSIAEIVNSTIRNFQKQQREDIEACANLKPGDPFEFHGLVGTTAKYPGYRGIIEALATKQFRGLKHG